MGDIEKKDLKRPFMGLSSIELRGLYQKNLQDEDYCSLVALYEETFFRGSKYSLGLKDAVTQTVENKNFNSEELESIYEFINTNNQYFKTVLEEFRYQRPYINLTDVILKELVKLCLKDNLELIEIKKELKWRTDPCSRELEGAIEGAIEENNKVSLNFSWDGEWIIKNSEYGRLYYPSGSLRYEGFIIKGKASGFGTEYSEKGKPINQGVFINDKYTIINKSRSKYNEEDVTESILSNMLQYELTPREVNSFRNLFKAIFNLDYDPIINNYIELREVVYIILDKLSYQEKKTIMLRYGLKDGYAETLESIGRKIDRAGSTVSKIHTYALMKLRSQSICNILKEYLD